MQTLLHLFHVMKLRTLDCHQCVCKCVMHQCSIHHGCHVLVVSVPLQLCLLSLLALRNTQGQRRCVSVKVNSIHSIDMIHTQCMCQTCSQSTALHTALLTIAHFQLGRQQYSIINSIYYCIQTMQEAPAETITPVMCSLVPA